MTPNPSAGNASLMRLTTVELHPTNRGNANCLFCRLHGRKVDAGELPDEWWLKLVDELRELDVAAVTISGGGEPLMRPRLVLQMMEKLTAAGIGGSLITNGMLITDEIARHIVEIGWPSVQVSLHAASAPLNDALMDKAGAFSLALEGIRRLQGEKQRRKSGLPEVFLRTVLEQSNFRKVPELVGLTHTEQLAGVVVRLANSEEIRTNRSLAVNAEDYPLLRDVISRAKRAAQENGIKFEDEIGSSLMRQGETDDKTAGKNCSHHTCPFPFSGLVVFANGTAAPCNNYFDYQFKLPQERTGWLEDISQQPLLQAWQKGFSSLRQSLERRSNPPTVCKTCSGEMRYRREQWPQQFWKLRFDQLHRYKRFDEAIRFGTEQLDKHGTNGQLHFYLGKFYMLQGTYDLALAHFKSTVGEGQDEESKGLADLAQWAIGRCLLCLGDYSGAVEILRRTHIKSDKLVVRFNTSLDLAAGYFLLDRMDEMNDALKGAEEIVETWRENNWHGGDDESLRQHVQQWPSSMIHEVLGNLNWNKDLKKEVRFCKELLKRYPEHPLLLQYLGEFLIECEDYKGAIQVLERIGDVARETRDLHFLLGKCYFELRDYPKALKSLERNINSEESSPSSHFRSGCIMAICHRKLGQYDLAEQCLAKAKSFAGTTSGEGKKDGMLQWPHLYFQEEFHHMSKYGEHDEGILFGLEMLKEHPEHPALFHYLGEFHMELGQYDKAVEYLREAAKIDGKREGVWFSLGKCYFLTGRLKEAEQALRKNLKLTSDRQSRYHSWLLRAVCHMESKEYGQMRECLAKAAGFAEALRKSERWEERQLGESTGRWPAPFFHEAFRHLRRQKRYREGILFGLKMLKEYPEHPMLHHYIGEFHMELEEYAKAIECLSRAAELDPRMEWTCFSLGKCYYLTGRLKEAERALRENLKLTSNRQSHYHAWLFLAMVHHATGNPEACKRDLDALERLKDLSGGEIPLEKEFLNQLWQEHLLPRWLEEALSEKTLDTGRMKTREGVGEIRLE